MTMVKKNLIFFPLCLVFGLNIITFPVNYLAGTKLSNWNRIENSLNLDDERINTSTQNTAKLTI